MTRLQDLQQAVQSQPLRLVAPGTRAHAAVAILVREGEEGLSVLLLERALNQHDHWSGHISFPGGRVESRDASVQQTAERETREEVGIDLAGANLIGRLSDYHPAGLPIVISSFVYALADPPSLQLNPAEVAAAFWVPLAELCNPRRAATVQLRLGRRTRRFPALRLDHGSGQPLWGITYYLLRRVARLSSPTSLSDGSLEC